MKTFKTASKVGSLTRLGCEQDLHSLNLVPGGLLIFLFFNLFYFICLFLAALGLHCCMWAFSSCGEQGLLFIAVRGLVIAVACLVVEHGL